MGRTQYRNKDPNTIDISAAQRENGRNCYCFNCRDTRYCAKDCRKLKVKCPTCHFLGGGHKKECRCSNTQGVHATNSTQEAAMFWGDSSSQKEKPRKANLFAAVEQEKERAN